MNHTQSNILVTGAAGLVGSHLVKELVKQGRQVKALYHSSIPQSDDLKDVEKIQGDILDIIFLEEIMQDVEQVYHCAAIVSFNPRQKKIIHKINIEGTANIVNTCLNTGVKKLLHVSSVSALGRIRESEPVNEYMQWTAATSNSEYGKSKYLAEMEVWRGIGEGLQAVMIHPTIILGAADWGKGSSAIFKNMYHEFPWYAEGVTGFVDVQDVVRAMVMLMESDVQSQKFIISAENTTYKEVFTRIAINFNKKPPRKKVTPFLAEIVWRLEALKAKFTGNQPLVTKETARTARAKVYFDNSKLLQYFPAFQYTPLDETLERICSELKRIYSLR